jgi:hypothetical protein
MEHKAVFEQVLSQIGWIKGIIQKRGWDLTQDLVLEGPATEDEIKHVERELGIALPDDYKELFRLSKRLEFRYEYDEEMPTAFQYNCSGEINWNLNLLKEQLEYFREWVEVNALVPAHYDPEAAGETKACWADMIPLIEVANGDIIALGCSLSEVRYYSCQENDMHGRKLGDNLWEFLAFHAKTGFAGSEDWQLEPFFDLASDSVRVKEESVNRFVEWLHGRAQ